MEYKTKHLIWYHATLVHRTPFTRPCVCPWKSYLSLWKHDVLHNITLSHIMLWMVQKCRWNNVEFIWVWHWCNDHNSMKAQRVFFSVINGVDRMLFYIKCCGYILSGDFECHMTEYTHSSKISLKKTYDMLLHQYLSTLHSIMRLDMISNHGRGSPQRSMVKSASASSNMCK